MAIVLRGRCPEGALILRVIGQVAVALWGLLSYWVVASRVVVPWKVVTGEIVSRVVVLEPIEGYTRSCI